MFVFYQKCVAGDKADLTPQDETHHNRTGTSNGNNFLGSIIYSILITGYKASEILLVVNIPRAWVISDVAGAALYCC